MNSEAYLIPILWYTHCWDIYLEILNVTTSAATFINDTFLKRGKVNQMDIKYRLSIVLRNKNDSYYSQEFKMLNSPDHPHRYNIHEGGY